MSAEHAIDAEVRLYDHLFTAEDPTIPPPGSDDWHDNINTESLTVVESAKLEPALAEASIGQPVQFERLGYFCVDPDTTAERLVFNRTIGLRDSWAKIAKKQKG